MSLNGLRIGGQYTSPKKPPDWQVNLFCLFVVVPIMAMYLPWLAVTRPERGGGQ